MKPEKIKGSILDRLELVLLVIDIQDRLSKAMFNEAEMKLNSKRLIQLATIYNIPIIVTEQNPAKLGGTNAEIMEEAKKNANVHVIAKNAFDALAESDELVKLLERLNRRQIVIVGMESHICVFQTARSLSLSGFSVTIAADACASRTVENHNNALSLMQSCNCFISSCEGILFDIVKTANDANFKAAQALIK